MGHAVPCPPRLPPAATDTPGNRVVEACPPVPPPIATCSPSECRPPPLPSAQMCPHSALTAVCLLCSPPHPRPRRGRRTPRHGKHRPAALDRPCVLMELPACPRMCTGLLHSASVADARPWRSGSAPVHPPLPCTTPGLPDLPRPAPPPPTLHYAARLALSCRPPSPLLLPLLYPPGLACCSPGPLHPLPSAAPSRRWGATACPDAQNLRLLLPLPPPVLLPLPLPLALPPLLLRYGRRSEEAAILLAAFGRPCSCAFPHTSASRRGQPSAFLQPPRASLLQGA